MRWFILGLIALILFAGLSALALSLRGLFRREPELPPEEDPKLLPPPDPDRPASAAQDGIRDYDGKFGDR